MGRWVNWDTSISIDLLQVYATSGHRVNPYVPMNVKPVISLKSGIKTDGGIGTDAIASGIVCSLALISSCFWFITTTSTH